MQKYSEIIFYFFTVFNYYPNFGIGDFVAGTTPVSLIEQTFTFHKRFHLLTLTDGFVFHHNAKEQLLRIEVFVLVTVVMIAISMDWETMKNYGNKFLKD